MSDLISAAAGGGQGWAGLGHAVGGLASGPNPANYARGLSAGATVQSKLLDAKKKRDEALALQDLTSKLVDSGVPPERAAQIGAAASAGLGNFDQVSRGAGELQQQGIVDLQMAAAGGGATPQTLEQVNLLNAIRNGKPTDQTKVMGNTVLNPGLAPGSQQLETSPYGEDSLAQRAASSRYSTDTSAQSARYRADTAATTARGRKGYAGNDADAGARAAAQDQYYELRMQNKLPKGMTAKDIEHQFRTTGKVVGEDGQVLATYVSDEGDLVKALAPKRNGAAGPPSPSSDAEAEAEQMVDRAKDPHDPPPQAMEATQAIARGPTREASRLASEARAAIAKGADPAKVAARLRSMGVNPSAAGL